MGAPKRPVDCLGLLAGDFYTVPNTRKRSGTGDVRLVWQMLQEAFNDLWGVAGNHDTFQDRNRESHLPARPPPNCLDGKVVPWHGITVGGVSGSIGRSDVASIKKTPETFAKLLEQVLVLDPDILILHVPPFVDQGNVGSEMVRDRLLDSAFAGLLVCGHAPWRDRVQKVGKAICLNAHEAVITLVPEA